MKFLFLCFVSKLCSVVFSLSSIHVLVLSCVCCMAQKNPDAVYIRYMRLQYCLPVLVLYCILLCCRPNMLFKGQLQEAQVDQLHVAFCWHCTAC
jgi:hypothetical protein